MSPSGKDDHPSDEPDRREVGACRAPDLSARESEELINRIGRGVRAMVGDALLDPLPPGFKVLLDRLEGSERTRGRT